jgi:hypothetical protein
MSVNYARRRDTTRLTPVAAAREHTESVTQLIALRDYFAQAYAACDAHDMEDADGLFQQVLEIEYGIKCLAPHIHEERWISWLEEDAELQHDEQHPHPKCAICRMQAAA